jgi:hypothetical protein
VRRQTIRGYINWYHFRLKVNILRATIGTTCGYTLLLLAVGVVGPHRGAVSLVVQACRLSTCKDLYSAWTLLVRMSRGTEKPISQCVQPFNAAKRSSTTSEKKNRVRRPSKLKRFTFLGCGTMRSADLLQLVADLLQLSNSS